MFCNQKACLGSRTAFRDVVCTLVGLLLYYLFVTNTWTVLASIAHSLTYSLNFMLHDSRMTGFFFVFFFSLILIYLCNNHCSPPAPWFLLQFSLKCKLWRSLRCESDFSLSHSKNGYLFIYMNMFFFFFKQALSSRELACFELNGFILHFQDELKLSSGFSYRTSLF